MWDDTADMPFEQRFIAHRTIPVGPAALELEQAPPTLGGTDPLGTACTVWRGGERLVELLQARRELVAGKRIVELGSGTGIAGLACAAGGVGGPPEGPDDTYEGERSGGLSGGLRRVRGPGRTALRGGARVVGCARRGVPAV